MSSSAVKTRQERAESKKQQLVGQFNQVRLELGDVAYQASLLEGRKTVLTGMLKDLQAQYEAELKISPEASIAVGDGNQDASNIDDVAPGSTQEVGGAATLQGVETDVSKAL